MLRTIKTNIIIINNNNTNNNNNTKTAHTVLQTAAHENIDGQNSMDSKLIIERIWCPD